MVAGVYMERWWGVRGNGGGCGGGGECGIRRAGGWGGARSVGRKESRGEGDDWEGVI